MNKVRQAVETRGTVRRMERWLDPQSTLFIAMRGRRRTGRDRSVSDATSCAAFFVLRWRRAATGGRVGVGAFESVRDDVIDCFVVLFCFYCDHKTNGLVASKKSPVNVLP